MRAELDDRFSGPGAEPVPWSDVVAELEGNEIFWISTVRPDGRPHVTPLPAIWLDDALHFCTGAEEQKGRNLDRNPACALTTGTPSHDRGLDVVVEGKAVRVTDHDRLQRLADRWRSKLGWEFEVARGAFTQEGRDALVYEIALDKVLAFGKGEPFSQTRFVP